MRQVTKYISDDGITFSSAEDCLAHEALCIEVAKITNKLLDPPDTRTFHNGVHFVQQEEATFWEVRNAIMQLALKYTKHPAVVSAEFKHNFQMSLEDRVILESCPSPIVAAWSHIMRIADDYKEFGQIHFRDKHMEEN